MSEIRHIQTDSFQALNQELRAHKQNTEFILSPHTLFPMEAEDCTPMPLAMANTNYTETKQVGIFAEGMENAVLDFNGAELECVGQLLPIAVQNCRNIAVKNLTIDWKIPLSAEGVVVSMSRDTLDVHIDPNLYPFAVRDHRLYFLGNHEEALLWERNHTVFHPDTYAVHMDNGDELILKDCTALSEDTVRFTGAFPTVYPLGSIVVLRHSERLHAAAFIENCENICVENVVIHASAGLGLLCQFTKNPTFRKVKFQANEKKGRLMVGSHDDGLHLANNSGQILVEDCYFHGLMDDPINVHGIYASVDEIVDEYTVRAKFMHHQSRALELFARAGDRFAVIHPDTAEVLGHLTVESCHLEGIETFLLKFREKLPAAAEAGDALENLTNTPSFICRNNYFGACRARGILITTPKPVLVENNVFQSAGAAIQMAADCKVWYESGACRGVTIRRNTFLPECLCTPYENCQAVVTICPTVPKPEAGFSFHRNITLEDNTFFTPDRPVLYAYCAENLKFCNNRIIRCRGYSAKPNDGLIRLDYDKQVCIRGNRFIGDFTNKFTVTHTPPHEILCDEAEEK